MEIGLVRKIDIDQEMQQAYLDYAMSVIVARALPDARDGMKPVHRRILYAMYDMGLRPNTSFKKSARVVGEVLGKYHPHGDGAVYDAMARMAQDFSMRLLLVEGQGNFGSIDGDPPAAMRYTEARLAASSMEIMADIQKDTVNFISNFDESLTEPAVLPAAIPNLLVNGATGIAVGMSTNIPPHNLSEVIDAIIYMIGNWSKLDDITVEDLMQFIKGPDFPTGGVILAGLKEQGLPAAYGSGRGHIIIQARAHVEEMGRGRERIIVTELPYMTNKASLIERIAKLARDGDIEGISDLRDESDRQGMRIVIEISKNADANEILALLYKKTPMQGTFGIILLALVDGQPRMLSLKQALQVYIEHRLEIVRRRSEYDLEKAKARAHILEGLRVALQNLDEVIDLIRKAADVEQARERLMKRFKLNEIQAQAILDMPLRRLAALERKKIELEYKELQGTIKDLEGLLKSPKKMRELVASELEAVKEKFGERRRTQIVQMQAGASRTSMLTASDFISDHSTWVSVDRNGLISRAFEGKTPNMTGWSKPMYQIRCNTRDVLYIATQTGETAAIAVHALPEAESTDQGVPFWQISPLEEKHQIAALFSLPPKDERAAGWYVMTCTVEGLLKKSAVEEMPGVTAQTFQLAKVNEGDRLGWVALTDGTMEILMATANGMAIRFSEEEVRVMGMVSAGVMGIKLKEGDAVIGMAPVDEKFDVLLVASDGQAKRVKIAQFPSQGRYGQGVTAWKLGAESILLGMAHDKPNQQVTIHTKRYAPKTLRIDEAPGRTRQGNGKDVTELKENDSIQYVTVPWEAPGKLAEAPSSSSSGAKKNGTARKVKRNAAKKVSPAKKAGTKTATKRKTPAKGKTATKKKSTPKTKTTAKAKSSPKTKSKTAPKRKAAVKSKTSTNKK